MTTNNFLQYVMNCCIPEERFDGTVYTIAEVTDPEIGSWLLERFLAFAKIDYINNIHLKLPEHYSTDAKAVLQQKLPVRMIQIKIRKRDQKKLIYYCNLPFNLDFFDDYEEHIMKDLNKLRSVLEDRVDHAMEELGKACRDQERIEAKIKELGL